MKNSYLFALIIALFTFNAHASVTVNDMVRSQDFVISSQLSKSKNVAVGEQVRVVIDLETSTWFTKGTRIKPFSVNNAIVLMEQANVVNSTTRRDGKTFSSQRWEVPLYPLSSGVIDVPPIAVSVSVKGEGGDVSGTVVAQPMQLHTHLASENMSSNVAWVVANDASLTENISLVGGSGEQNELFVGDSLTRTIHVQANGTSAMLIPNLMEPTIWPNSTRVYLSQPQRRDKQVRGTSSATYKQQVTLIMEKPGVVTVPEIKLLWWNADTQEEQWLTLPAQDWQVQHTFSSYVNMYWMELSLGIGVCVLATVGLIQIVREFKRREKEGRLPLVIQFWQAVHRNQEARAHSVIYRRLLARHQRYQLIDSHCESPWDSDGAQLHESYKPCKTVADKVGILTRIWKQVSS